LLSYFLIIARNIDHYCYNGTFPINADEPPSRAIPTATLAGAPPGAFLNAGASDNESPLMVGTKSISISPKQTTREESFVSGDPSPPNALPGLHKIGSKRKSQEYHNKL
jgi:hypothetical protein